MQPVISGIQSKGVIANAKHYVNNNQETDRSGGNEVVDERTRWEMYYPPFLGAIKAEVGSIMCSCAFQPNGVPVVDCHLPDSGCHEQTTVSTATTRVATTRRSRQTTRHAPGSKDG